MAASQWKYTDGSAWHVDTKLRVAATIICTLLAIIIIIRNNSTHLCLSHQVNCLDVAVSPECMYNDQTDFVGGDLPQVEVFVGGGSKTLLM